MDYANFITTVATLLEVPITDAASATPSSDVNFNNVLPWVISSTQLRIERDLDLINTIITDSTGSTTANTRKFTYPTDQGTWIVVQQAALIVGGLRQPPMLPVSRETLDYTYPQENSLGVPSYPVYWCPNDGVSLLIGPPTDQAYPVELVGTIRIVDLSATNTTNFLTLQLPDLYIAASMALFAAYQRDWGSRSDDPAQAMSWENEYKLLLEGADVENLRSKFRSIGNSARSVSPIAAQPAN